jgi:hypothetical protein
MSLIAFAIIFGGAFLGVFLRRARRIASRELR